MAEANTKLFSVNAISELLERDRRTIARALRDTPPDGRDAQGPRWKLSSAVAALSTGNDGNANAAAVAAIERAAEDVGALLERLRKAATVEAAREIARRDGRAVGALDRALEAGQAGLRPAERALLEIARNRIVGLAMGELLDRCEWTLPAAAA